MNGHWRVVPSHHASRFSGGSFTTSPRPTSIQRSPSFEVGARPGDLPGQALAGECAAGDREVRPGLAVAVDAAERVGIVVEGVGAARAGVEQHPDEAALVLPAPAHVVEHHRLVEPLRLEEPLQQLHRHEVALVGLGASRRSVSPFVSGRQAELSSPSAKSDGGRSGMEAELVLPAQAVGLELLDQLEHGQVVAELLAGGGLGEVLGSLLAVVEGDALVAHEAPGVLDPGGRRRPRRAR